MQGWAPLKVTTAGINDGPVCTGQTHGVLQPKDMPSRLSAKRQPTFVQGSGGPQTPVYSLYRSHPCMQMTQDRTRMPTCRDTAHLLDEPVAGFQGFPLCIGHTQSLHCVRLLLHPHIKCALLGPCKPTSQSDMRPSHGQQDGVPVCLGSKACP